tara:strand:+ start:146 stop:847 length:702 start_codon:yes stop_codon:yes gene_type:complete
MLEFINNIFLQEKIFSIIPILFFIKLVISGINGIVFIYITSFYSNFAWLRNKFHIFVGFALPLIGLAITTIIGNNIALSLGMIGALSIVRFRTPIRSSFELVVYFSLLTFGVVGSVDLGTSIMVSFILIIFLLSTISIQKLSFLSKIKNFFESKFFRGSNYTFHLTGSMELNFLSNFYKLYKIKNFSVEKIDDNICDFNGLILFDNQAEIDKFINNNKNIKIKSFEIVSDENY